MSIRIGTLLKSLALTALLVSPAAAQERKTIRVGVIYDLTGVFAATGSEAAQIGTRAAIDWFNEKGGAGGYRIEPIYADMQSKAEIATAQTELLLRRENVDLLLGGFSSAQCLPIAQRANDQKRFFWITVCNATSVFEDKGLTYVFRPQVHSDQQGWTACTYLRDVTKDKLGIEPKKLKVAIIHDAGLFSAGVANANQETCGKEYGMQVVMREAYHATSLDLSSLVSNLRRARPDVILHTGYSRDVAQFLELAKKEGLRFKALIGQGGGYSEIDRLRDKVGDTVELVHNVDPAPVELLDPKTLVPGLSELAAEMKRRYQALKGAGEPPPQAGMAFNATWIFLAHVLPRAIERHGGIESDALRKAALETDLPLGATLQGYGVKFAPPGNPLSGQNLRATPIVMQYVNGKAKVVWPAALRTAEPILPFPKGHAFGP